MNMRPAKPLDREPVELLTRQFLIAIRAHYRMRPTARSTAQEVLNALGIAAAFVIHGTGSPQSRDEAHAFFDQAVDQELADLVADASVEH